MTPELVLRPGLTADVDGSGGSRQLQQSPCPMTCIHPDDPHKRKPLRRRRSAHNAKVAYEPRSTRGPANVRRFEQRVSPCSANRIANERVTTLHHEASLAGSGAAQRPWLDLPATNRYHLPAPASCDLNLSGASALCGFDSHPGHVVEPTT